MPEIVHLEITDQCNMACPMCGTLEHRRRDNKPHLGREEIASRVLGPIRRLGANVLVISGGEPTLAPHLTATVQDALGLGFRNIFLATNLFRLEVDTFSALLALLDADRHVIQTSFDSIKPGEMNAIRGKEVYESVLANCRQLGELKK